MASVHFNETKATQAAAQLLKLCGGSMGFGRLIKLLYLADRKALERWSRPITTDRYVSMKLGPVLSNVLDLAACGDDARREGPWADVISAPDEEHMVSLQGDALDDELSRAEIELIAEVFAEYGSKSFSALVDLVHTLPEWKDPGYSSEPISYADILSAVGKTPEEIEQIEDELDATGRLDILAATG